MRAEPKAPPKIEDSKMEALVAIKGKEELCSKCERGPPRTCEIVIMLLLFFHCFHLQIEIQFSCRVILH